MHIDGLVQNRSISSALAMEILQSCTKLSTYLNVQMDHGLSFLPNRGGW